MSSRVRCREVELTPETILFNPYDAEYNQPSTSLIMTPLQLLVKPPQQRRITPYLVQEVKDKLYKNYTLDLSVARTKVPLGLRNNDIVADTMTVIRATGTFDYMMNNPASDATPGEKGLTEDQFEIEEVYITNPAQVGQTAIIRVIWNPHLIRIKD